MIVATLLVLCGAGLGYAAITGAGPATPGATQHRATPVAVVQPLPPMLVVPATSLMPVVKAGRPLELRAAAIGVDAGIDPVSAEGQVLVPPGNTLRVGWWSAGSRAGERIGTTLLTGHTVHTGGGVFNNLGRLHVGDQIEVRTADGWLAYTVHRVLYLTVDQLSRRAPSLFAADRGPRLALVTCAAWDGVQYGGNTVVMAHAAWTPALPPATVSANAATPPRSGPLQRADQRQP